MFTGIITQCGTVLEIERINNSAKLRIATQFVDVQTGESIAVDGVCLTVTEVTVSTEEGSFLSFDVSPETLSLTTLHFLHRDRKVNLERALRLADRLGGHFVTGHIDQVAELALLENQAEFTCMVFMGIDKTAIKNMIKKGSIAVNGVSLTINNLLIPNDDCGFEVMVIPQTLRQTNFLRLKIGDKVNIEFDMLVKIVNHQI